MDAVSYAHSAKQAQRIESFIENPDSMSGIVTVPKVIASGETITIPTGRVAVLPNVQVDGELNIEGDVFIPSGATFADLESQIALKANINSPALTGTPTAPTQTAGDNSTKLATTAYVDGKMVLGTAINASGTSVDFTGIPSWAKKITVMLNGVSTNGTSHLLCQLGTSSGVENSGYFSLSSVVNNAVANSTGGVISSSGFILYTFANTDLKSGITELNKINGNAWIETHNIAIGVANWMNNGSGNKTTANTLDRIRITTINGTDTFDAGSINIMYEG